MSCCLICGRTNPQTTKGRKRKYCSDYHKLKNWQLRHPKKAKQLKKNNFHNRRIRALKVINSEKVECFNCGCDDTRILQINHINGDGKKQRENSSVFYGKLLRGARKTEDLNILCLICNWVHFVKLKYGIGFKIKTMEV